MSYRDNYVDNHNYQTSIPDPLPSSYPALYWVIGGYSFVFLYGFILFLIWV